MHQETEAQSAWNEHEVLRKEANKYRLSYSTVQTEKSVALQTTKGAQCTIFWTLHSRLYHMPCGSTPFDRNLLRGSESFFRS